MTNTRTSAFSGRRPWTRCHWPRCDADPGPTLAPLCFQHLAIAHQIFCGITDDLIGDSLRRNAEQEPDPRPTDGLVYFVRLGNLVKIGFTINLRQRMVDVPHEEILGTVPGTMEDEKRCHAAFAHLRVKGEWFRPEPDLLAFIAEVAA